MKAKNKDYPEQLLQTINLGLADLNLKQVAAAFDEQLASPTKDLTRLEWFWRILGPQVRLRRENRVERRIRESKLPVRKTFQAFDFDFQPGLDKDLIMELATLRFIDEGTNILFAGKSGTGKSHLAMALGLAAGLANLKVVYTTSAAMLAALNASLVDNTLDHALKRYVSPELLIIDEVGLEQVEQKEATRSGLMQKVLFPRYDYSRSTVITSNIPWKHWGDYLDDHLGAAAIIDRLIHRSHIIVIDGPSWRDKEHKRQVEQRKQKKKAAE